jgi:thioredoxin 2
MEATMLDSTGLIVRCEQCGQGNRLRFNALGRLARCGKCKGILALPRTPADVPAEDVFTRLTEQSSLPVLVDFWAEWCGPCRMVAPELEKIAASHAGTVLVAKVDTEALSGVAARLGIQSIPTMAIFHQGRELARTSGARPASAIAEFVEHALAERAR